MIRTVDIYETPVIGVFATCTEDFVLVPRGTKPETCAILEDSLDVKAIETLVNGSVVIGALSRGNSNGFLFSYGTDTREVQKLTGVKAEILPGRLNAVGNIVLANDSAALVHPELSDRAIETIASVLEVEVYRGTIAGIKNVGMAGVVTNKGLLVHPGDTGKYLQASGIYRNYELWNSDARLRPACELKELSGRFGYYRTRTR